MLMPFWQPGLKKASPEIVTYDSKLPAGGPNGEIVCDAGDCAVFLNGKRIHHAMAADAEQGWVKYIVLERSGGRIVTEEGNVVIKRKTEL